MYESRAARRSHLLQISHRFTRPTFSEEPPTMITGFSLILQLLSKIARDAVRADATSSWLAPQSDQASGRHDAPAVHATLLWLPLTASASRSPMSTPSLLADVRGNG
jgi:hypothetical protein